MDARSRKAADTRRANAAARSADAPLPEPLITYFERPSSRRDPVLRVRDKPTARQQREINLHCLLDYRDSVDEYIDMSDFIDYVSTGDVE